jgi:hypothetical protein
MEKHGSASTPIDTPSIPIETDEERRAFLANCGKFAIVTPPAVTMMLTTASIPKHAAASTFPGSGWGGPPKKHHKHKGRHKGHHKHRHRHRH